MRENGPVIYQKIDTPKGRIVKILLNRPDHGNRIDGSGRHGLRGQGGSRGYFRRRG